MGGLRRVRFWLDLTVFVLFLFGLGLPLTLLLDSALGGRGGGGLAALWKNCPFQLWGRFFLHVGVDGVLVADDDGGSGDGFDVVVVAIAG